MSKSSQVSTVKTVKGDAVASLSSIQEVFPSCFMGGVNSWEDIACLGKNNIGYLLSQARNHESNLSSQIKSLRKKLEFFQGKKGGDFRRLAESYDYPVIRSIGKRAGGWDIEPTEPTDIASEFRAYGASTYNICGWCKHASGTHRYNYCISGYCGMLSEASETTSKPDELQFSHPVKVKFFTQCILQKLSFKQCQTIFDTIEKKVEKLKARREHLRVAIRKLIELRDASNGKMPWLVSFRPHDYMNIGDEMVAYIGQWGDDSEITGDWVDAMGIYHDGCMSIMAMQPIHSNTDYLRGRYSCATVDNPSDHPSVMHRWEFDFLSNAMQSLTSIESVEQLKKKLSEKGGLSEEVRFVGIWFENIKYNLSRFDVFLFGKALIKPQFVQAPKKQEKSQL